MKRPQFTIRDLLLVTVIAALALGWWLDHRVLAPKAEISDKLLVAVQQKDRDLRKVFESNQYIEKRFEMAREALMRLRDHDPDLVDAAIYPAANINAFQPLPPSKNQFPSSGP